MALQEELNTLKLHVQECETELQSLQSGRKAAASRCRKSLQSIKSNAHSLRKSVTTFTKAMPVKSRKLKEEEPPTPAPAEVSEMIPVQIQPEKKRVRKIKSPEKK